MTRIFAKLVKEGRIEAGPQCPTDVLVVHPPQREWKEIAAVADALRRRGLNVEMYHAPRKLGAQLRYASRKGIPHVWFPPFDAGGSHEVKDLESGEQHPADPTSWRPER